MIHSSEQLSPVSTQTLEEAKKADEVQYGDLVDTIELSIARQLAATDEREITRLQGAQEAASLIDILAPLSADERHEVRCKIGLKFDDALVDFVVAAMIARRDRSLVIVADTTAGIDGYLPWEEPLKRRITMLEERQILTGVDIQVERRARIRTLAPEVGERACEQTLELLAS